MKSGRAACKEVVEKWGTLLLVPSLQDGNKSVRQTRRHLPPDLSYRIMIFPELFMMLPSTGITNARRAATRE